jgi:hypothetical protein
MQIMLNLCVFATLLSSSNGLQVDTMSPVSKVAKLLEDMLKQMEKDADDDQDTADKMFCWCETNDKDKTKAIADNTQKVEDLKAEISALTAKSQKLNTEIDKITEELKENQESLETSVAMRKKELKEFNTAEASTFQSIKQLTGAVEALSKKGLMQTEITLDDSTPAYHAIKHAIRMHGKGDMLWAMHSEKSRQLLQQMMAHHGELSLLQTHGKASITAPSDIIVGTINGMNDAFKENLKQLQDDENSAQNAHSASKKEKEKEIAAAIAMIDEKTGIVADTDEKNAADKEDLKDTTATLAADQEYLKNLKEQCEIFGKEFEARKKTRLAEIGACSKALEFLTSDEAKDLFTKSLGGTKRGEKMGSKDLAEFKEARDTESMRSQTSKARKAKWGTAERYLFNQQSKSLSLLQIASDTDRHEEQSLDNEEKSLLALEEQDLTEDALKDINPHHVDAKKLATLAKRSEAYWAATYYKEALKANETKALAEKENREGTTQAHFDHLKAAHKHKHHHKKHRKGKKQLGLTASQVKVRKTAMAAVGNGIGDMIENLEMQQGEEASRNDWCVDEIAATEKALQKEKQMKDRCETKIKYNTKDMTKLKEEVKQLNYAQEDADIELQKGANDRRKGNMAFQETVLNQLGTSRLLTKALEVLNSFYKKSKASLLREKARVERTKDIRQAASVVSGAAGAWINGDQTFSFKHAKAVEAQNVAAASKEELHAEMKKVIKEKAEDKAMLQTAEAAEQPQEDPWDSEERKAEQESSASKWLSSYSTGAVLLQKNDADSPHGQVAKLLEEAKASEAEAQEYIKKAESMSRPEAALLQQEPAGPPPPTGFKSYEKSGQSGGVTVMIQNLIDDADAMVKEAVKDETSAMEAYEVLVSDANAATTQRQKEITDRNARIGELEAFTAEEEEKLQETLFKVKTLRQTDIDLHGVEGCDYLMDNYATRHVERQEEIDSLKEANAILGAGGGEKAAEAAGQEPTEPPLDEGLTEAMGEEEETDGPGEAGSTKKKAVPEGVEVIGPGGERAIAKVTSL